MRHRSLSPFESLRADKAVMDELQHEAASRRKFPREEFVNGGRKAILSYLREPGSAEAPLESSERLPEAIILAQGRPTLLIQNGTFADPLLDIWKKRLAVHRQTLEAAIPSVGRVEVLRHPRFEWLGTAWVVAEKVLVTNRHVALEFARRRGADFAFINNPFGESVGAQIDFREEYKGENAFEVQVERVLFISDLVESQPDIAFLLLADHAKFPAPLNLAARDPKKDDPIAIIGYPAFDTRNDGPTMTRIFEDIYDVKRLAPGFVTFAAEAAAFEHDCTTLGGNSGSPVVNVDTGEAVGLHFAGKFGVANFAVKASIVKQMLGRLGGVSVGGGGLFGGPPGGAERAPRPEDYDDRKGYDERFLGSTARHHVALPQLSAEQLDDAIELDSASGRGLARYLLDYGHFSLVMCKSRRVAYYTAVNIDGNGEASLGSRRPPWIFDPRIPRDLQIGDEVYAGPNKVDRGHLVRRLDPVWGSAAEAKQAHRDTFHFTNAAPQQHTYNDSDWGDLEDYLLYNVNNANQRLTLFSGPVLRASDITWRGVQISEEFWKLAVMLGPDDKLHATAYLVSQRPYLDDLEFLPGQFNNYQVTLAKVEELTGLDFGGLKQFDPLGDTESAFQSTIVRLRGISDMLL